MSLLFTLLFSCAAEVEIDYTDSNECTDAQSAIKEAYTHCGFNVPDHSDKLYNLICEPESDPSDYLNVIFTQCYADALYDISVADGTDCSIFHAYDDCSYLYKR